MTEAEWLTCTDSDEMAEFLRRSGRPASGRQLWLFACACCRRISQLMASEQGRAGVEAGERYADRLITTQELDAIATGEGTCVAILLQMLPKKIPSKASVFLVRMEVEAEPPASQKAAQAAATAKQADLLRDIFGNPFRPLPSPPGAITPLAERIYTGEWNLMPLLGEWLQEHGYWDQGEHCLDPNIHHVKGCWVVDWVTGRE